MVKNIKLSIIIISRNRDHLVEKAITSVADRINILQEYEVVVVDNNSIDDTRKVVLNFRNTSPKIKYVFESIPGVSTAKNSGIKHTKGEYIAFLDDDSIAEKFWVDQIIKHAKKYPDHMIFGGPYNRYSTIKIPNWIPSKFGILDNGEEARQLSMGREWLSATNLVIKKEVFTQIGEFDQRLNMTSSNRIYGEETEFQLRAIKNGINIFYDPSMKVTHLLNPRKLNLFWLLKDSFIRGKNTYLLQNKYYNLFSKKTKKNNKIHQESNLIQKMVVSLQLISYGIGKIYGKFSNETI